MDYLSPIAAIIGIGLVAYVFYTRRSGGAGTSNKQRIVLAVYDGEVTRFYEKVSRVGSGLEVLTENGKIVYPFNVCAAAGGQGRTTLYIVGADRLALAQHEAFEIGRQTIAFKAIFKSGGDLVFALQIAALAVPIIVCVFLALQFSGVQSSLQQLTADIKIVREVQSKPAVPRLPAAPGSVPGIAPGAPGAPAAPALPAAPAAPADIAPTQQRLAPTPAAPAVPPVSITP